MKRKKKKNDDLVSGDARIEYTRVVSSVAYVTCDWRVAGVRECGELFTDRVSDEYSRGTSKSVGERAMPDERRHLFHARRRRRRRRGVSVSGVSGSGGGGSSSNSGSSDGSRRRQLELRQ